MMIGIVEPIQFHEGVSSGKTKPSRIVCEQEDGALVEVIAKFSGSCEQGVASLARECIGACLAADLNLPVPRPHLVRLTPEWVETIPDPERRATAEVSGPYAFGSTVVPPGFRLWTAADKLGPAMVPAALAVFVFDAMTFNPDRRSGNPNCLVRGDDLRIFDHELSFTQQLILFWKEPWTVGALHALERPGAHIFREALLGRECDFRPIQSSWEALSDERLEEYRAALPNEWADATDTVVAALSLIAGVRDHIEECLTEVLRVLT